MGLLLTGLGVFGVPDANDFRDWDSYYEKRDALDAEWNKLSWESNKLHKELKTFISRYVDNSNSSVETPEERSSLEGIRNQTEGTSFQIQGFTEKS